MFCQAKIIKITLMVQKICTQISSNSSKRLSILHIQDIQRSATASISNLTNTLDFWIVKKAFAGAFQ